MKTLTAAQQRFDLAKLLFRQFLEAESANAKVHPSSVHARLRKALWKAAYEQAAKIIPR